MAISDVTKNLVLTLITSVKNNKYENIIALCASILERLSREISHLRNNDHSSSLKRLYAQLSKICERNNKLSNINEIQSVLSLAIHINEFFDPNAITQDDFNDIEFLNANMRSIVGLIKARLSNKNIVNRGISELLEHINKIETLLSGAQERYHWNYGFDLVEGADKLSLSDDLDKSIEAYTKGMLYLQSSIELCKKRVQSVDALWVDKLLGIINAIITTYMTTNKSLQDDNKKAKCTTALHYFRHKLEEQINAHQASYPEVCSKYQSYLEAIKAELPSTMSASNGQDVAKTSGAKMREDKLVIQCRDRVHSSSHQSQEIINRGKRLSDVPLKDLPPKKRYTRTLR